MNCFTVVLVGVVTIESKIATSSSEIYDPHLSDKARCSELPGFQS